MTLFDSLIQRIQSARDGRISLEELQTLRTSPGDFREALINELEALAHKHHTTYIDMNDVERVRQHFLTC